MRGPAVRQGVDQGDLVISHKDKRVAGVSYYELFVTCRTVVLENQRVLTPSVVPSVCPTVISARLLKVDSLFDTCV